MLKKFSTLVLVSSFTIVGYANAWGLPSNIGAAANKFKTDAGANINGRFANATTNANSTYGDLVNKGKNAAANTQTKAANAYNQTVSYGDQA